MNKLYIGISGFARTGKDLCGRIIQDLLNRNGLVSQRFALADELKMDVEEFLKVKCNVSPYIDDSEVKAKIRPFLVWYGCYQRNRQPDYWIKQVEKNIEMNSMNSPINVVVCTDIRFKNEADWIHSKDGWLIHLTKFTKESNDGGKTWQRVFQQAPNEEELKNDPLVKNISDHQIVWEDLCNGGKVKVTTEELSSNMYLREEVYKSLVKCPRLSQLLKKA